MIQWPADVGPPLGFFGGFFLILSIYNESTTVHNPRRFMMILMYGIIIVCVM